MVAAGDRAGERPYRRDPQLPQHRAVRAIRAAAARSTRSRAGPAPPRSMPRLADRRLAPPVPGGWACRSPTGSCERAREHGGFELEVADLAEVTLPLLDEPNHPRLRQYTREHTHAWSATVDVADAVVLVTSEYNYGYPAALKNAIDYLHHEWRYKPVGFVSYGGVAAGTRAVQQLKQVVTALRMMPVGGLGQHPLRDPVPRSGRRHRGQRRDDPGGGRHAGRARHDAGGAGAAALRGAVGLNRRAAAALATLSGGQRTSYAAAAAAAEERVDELGAGGELSRRALHSAAGRRPAHRCGRRSPARPWPAARPRAPTLPWRRAAARARASTVEAIIGARFAVGSSRTTRAGSSIRALPMASILRSPPLSLPARRPSIRLSCGNTSSTCSTRPETSRALSR